MFWCKKNTPFYLKKKQLQEKNLPTKSSGDTIILVNPEKYYDIAFRFDGDVSEREESVTFSSPRKREWNTTRRFDAEP